MKYIAVAVLAIAFVCTVFADWDDYDDRICETDRDCSYDDCCVLDPRSTNGLKACQDHGDDVGEPCGGPHFCGCDRGYICVPFPAPPVRRFRGYYNLANGTCQRDPSFFRNANAIDGNVRFDRRPYRRGSDSDSDEFDDDWDDRR